MRDRYGRFLGICYLNELDLNGWLVRNGYAPRLHALLAPVRLRRGGGPRKRPRPVGRGIRRALELAKGRTAHDHFPAVQSVSWQQSVEKPGVCVKLSCMENETVDFPEESQGLSEDWVVFGPAFILIALGLLFPYLSLPKFSWTPDSVGKIFSAENISLSLSLGMVFLFFSSFGVRMMGGSVARYVAGFPHSLRTCVGIQVSRRKRNGQGMGSKLRHLRPFNRNVRRQRFPQPLPGGSPNRVLHQDRAYHPGFRHPVRQDTLRGIGGDSPSPVCCARHLVRMLLDLQEIRR